MNTKYDKIALLIIFSYDDSVRDNIRWTLPGIGIDLYHSYNYVRTLGVDKILVITDIILDLHVGPLRNTIARGIVDTNIISIITNIKKNNNYWYYTHKNQLIEKIKKYVNNSDHIFIYYSGHASYNTLILPKVLKSFSYQDEATDINKDLYNANNFMSDIINNAQYNSQIFFILDCCQLSSMNLPYQLRNDKYHLYTSIKFNDKSRIYPKQEIICITSSSINENSLIASHGSVFSSIIFKILNNLYYMDNYLPDNYNIDDKRINYYSLKYILNILNSKCSKVNDQTSNIYVSYPNLKMIWSWIIGKTKALNIEFDHIGKTIQITKK
uniref:Caspase n=1 Tax=Pithovirus LCPAC102 TaxID=2506587 RepID=A0A481Z580_9VIRU|nr:MAG: caspase [Pithovirus LCPAC102]